MMRDAAGNGRRRAQRLSTGEIVTVVVTGAVAPAEFVLSTSLASAK